MQWRRELWLAVLIIGSGTFVAGERILAASNEPGLVTPILVIGVATAPVAFYVACRGHRFTLPGGVVVAAAVSAAVLGSAMAGLLGYYALVGLGPVATVGVALAEESVTLLVPLAVLFALPTRRAADGLLVGAAAGAGFAVAETAGYLMTLPSIVGPAAHDVLLRGLLAPAAQLAWGGIAAAALWLAAQEHWNARALRRLVLAMSGVIALHALWESVDGVATRTALTVLNGVLLGWVLTRTTSRRGVPTRVLSRPDDPTGPKRGAVGAERGAVSTERGASDAAGPELRGAGPVGRGTASGAERGGAGVDGGAAERGAGPAGRGGAAGRGVGGAVKRGVGMAARRSVGSAARRAVRGTRRDPSENGGAAVRENGGAAVRSAGEPGGAERVGAPPARPAPAAHPTTAAPTPGAPETTPADVAAQQTGPAHPGQQTGPAQPGQQTGSTITAQPAPAGGAVLATQPALFTDAVSPAAPADGVAASPAGSALPAQGEPGSAVLTPEPSEGPEADTAPGTPDAASAEPGTAEADTAEASRADAGRA